MKTVWYDSFCPKVFITTHAVLPSDTASRCIEVIMQKAKATEKDYGEEWYNPTRLVRLKKIREMSLLFRLKFGKEIRDISQDPQWRQKLDLSDTFVGIKNRELEIFRPLVILCLKYAPEWKDMVATYIRKNIEMRSKLDPTPVNTVLYALRSIYQDVQRMSYFPENNELSAEVCSDAVYGDVMYVSIKAIEERVKHTTDMIDLGNNPASRIGRILKDLGFTTPSIRRTFGMVRILKLSHLSDVCERYLGMVLDAEMEPGKKKLSQQERIGAIQYAFQTKKGQMTYDELLAEVGEKLTRDEVDSILKHLKEQGYVMVMGKELVWC